MPNLHYLCELQPSLLHGVRVCGGVHNVYDAVRAPGICRPQRANTFSAANVPGRPPKAASPDLRICK